MRSIVLSVRSSTFRPVGQVDEAEVVSSICCRLQRSIARSVGVLWHSLCKNDRLFPRLTAGQGLVSVAFAS